MDGTPVFAEAECVVIRVVDKTTFRIHELVLHLALYAGSLNGEAIAAHVFKALDSLKTIDAGGNVTFEVKPTEWRATSLDRAKTNMKANRLVKGRCSVTPLDCYCLSHGYSGCGKKHEMVAGKKILKQFTKMVQHSLCAARTFFAVTFGEQPKKTGGVRWGIELEMCEQVNRVLFVSVTNGLRNLPRSRWLC